MCHFWALTGNGPHCAFPFDQSEMAAMVEEQLELHKPH